MVERFKPAPTSLKKFETAELPPEVEHLIGVRTRTGVWTDALVPMFQRLDAALGLSEVARP